MIYNMQPSRKWNLQICSLFYQRFSWELKKSSWINFLFLFYSHSLYNKHDMVWRSNYDCFKHKLKSMPRRRYLDKKVCYFTEHLDSKSQSVAVLILKIPHCYEYISWLSVKEIFKCFSKLHIFLKLRCNKCSAKRLISEIISKREMEKQ